MTLGMMMNEFLDTIPKASFMKKIIDSLDLIKIKICKRRSQNNEKTNHRLRKNAKDITDKKTVI